LAYALRFSQNQEHTPIRLTNFTTVAKQLFLLNAAIVCTIFFHSSCDTFETINRHNKIFFLYLWHELHSFWIGDKSNSRKSKPCWKRTLTRFGTTRARSPLAREERRGERDTRVITLRCLLWRILILDSRGQGWIKVRFPRAILTAKDGRIRFSLLESINSERKSHRRWERSKVIGILCILIARLTISISVSGVESRNYHFYSILN